MDSTTIMDFNTNNKKQNFYHILAPLWETLKGERERERECVEKKKKKKRRKKATTSSIPTPFSLFH